jgi:hypothetical protein
MSFKQLGLAAAILLGSAAPAAAFEAWTMFDNRILVTEPGELPGAPNHWRIYSQFRYGQTYSWIGQGLLRTGPIWLLHPNFQLATNMTNNLEQQSGGGYRHEIRAELEPTLSAEWGRFGVTDRTRIEKSWFGDGTGRWRLRNQLRVTYKVEGWKARPWISNEGFYILGSGPSENRLQLGVSIPTADTDRMDLGYMMRARDTSSGWDVGHVATLTLLFGPERQPLIDGPSGE